MAKNDQMQQSQREDENTVDSKSLYVRSIVGVPLEDPSTLVMILVEGGGTKVSEITSWLEVQISAGKIEIVKT